MLMFSKMLIKIVMIVFSISFGEDGSIGGIVEVSIDMLFCVVWFLRLVICRCC